MAKVNKSQFTSKHPKLEQDDLEKDAAVLTIESADVITVEDDEQESGERTSIVLSFKETEDKVMWPNPSEIGVLIDKLGDDTDKWVGKQVPVEKVTRKFKGRSYPKIGIVEADEWDGYLGKKGKSGKR